MVSPLKATVMDIDPAAARGPHLHWLGRLAVLPGGDAAHHNSIPAGAIDLAAAEHPNEAVMLLEVAARLTPGRPELHVRWARQLRNHGALDLARAMCNAAFATDGDLPELRRARADVLDAAGYHDAAAEDRRIATDALAAAAAPAAAAGTPGPPPSRRLHRRIAGQLLRPLRRLLQI